MKKVKDLLGRVSEAGLEVRERTESALSSVKDSVDEVAVTTANKASDFGSNIMFQAESTYESVVGTVDNVIDTTVTTVKNTCEGIAAATVMIGYAGITVGAVVAPVPTFIGIGLLWLLELSFDAVKTSIQEELKDNKKKREFERVTKLLKKYGRIPETAVVRTEFFELEINSVEGTAVGTLLKGPHKGQTLCNLTEAEVQNLLESSPDKETKSLLEAYISYDQKRKAEIQ